MRKQVWIATGALALAGAAHAQSSVTLYGIVDAGIGYQSSSAPLGATTGGRSQVKMLQGVWAANRLGFKGSEDLGGGTKAIFTLEQGFNLATGAEQVNGLGFSRIAMVGMTNSSYGTLTAGREYSPYYTLLQPFSPEPKLTGYYGAHPGDIDATDTDYHLNNSVVYTSPNFNGLTFSASYAIGGVAGSFNAGSSWSAAAQYIRGRVGLAAAFWRINNSTPGGGAWGAASTASNNGAQLGLSSVNIGYQTAAAQQRAALAGMYVFNSQWDVTAMYTNTQYIPGSNSAFTDTAVFNTAGVVLHFKPSAAWDFSAGYAYTRAAKANQITRGAQYNQINFAEIYSLSKRTNLYALQGWQRASGQTLGINGGGDIVNATAMIGDGADSTPGTARSQFVAGVGITTRF